MTAPVTWAVAPGVGGALLARVAVFPLYMLKPRVMQVLQAARFTLLHLTARKRLSALNAYIRLLLFGFRFILDAVTAKGVVVHFACTR